MATEYTIYLVNQMSSTQVFWCFLQPPEGLPSEQEVFANSSTFLAVAPNYPGTNTFTIPVQFTVGAGASNQAVGLNIRLQSWIQLNADLTDQFTATYMGARPPQGPNLTQTGSGATPTNIDIITEPFDKTGNEADSWYASQSFGIQTMQGYIGMTWSPDPGVTRSLEPQLTFFVATGTYESHKLASYTDISTTSAALKAPADFSLQREATVTRTSSGTWEVTPGPPPLAAGSSFVSLARSHEHLTKAHAALLDRYSAAAAGQLSAGGGPESDSEAAGS